MDWPGADAAQVKYANLAFDSTQVQLVANRTASQFPRTTDQSIAH
jgi:hypothetical protein